VVHGENCSDEEPPENLIEPPAPWRPSYKMGDSDCGSIVCYADDSSESVSDSNLEELKVSMETQYNATASFLTSSRLQVNDGKTHTMLLTTSQNRRLNNLNLTVTIGAVQKQSSTVERLLGLQLHENLKFREYIQDNDKSLLKSLNTRLNALKQIK
jgi:hypothetical protein